MHTAGVKFTELISCLMLEYDVERVELISREQKDRQREIPYPLDTRRFCGEVFDSKGHRVDLPGEHQNMLLAICTWMWTACEGNNGDTIQVIWHLDTKTVEVWTELAHHYRQLRNIRLSRQPKLKRVVESLTKHYCWGEPLTEVKVSGNYQFPYEDSLSASIQCYRSGESIACIQYQGKALSSVDADDPNLRHLISKHFRELTVLVDLLKHLGTPTSEEGHRLITSGFFIRMLPYMGLVEFRQHWIESGVRLVTFYDDEQILGEKR